LSTGQTPDRKLETGESRPTYEYRGRSAYHYYYRIPGKIHLPLLLLNTGEETPSSTTTTTTFVIEIIVTFRNKSFEKYHFKN
jgi:hypothetical protein